MAKQFKLSTWRVVPSAPPKHPTEGPASGTLAGKLQLLVLLYPVAAREIERLIDRLLVDLA